MAVAFIQFKAAFTKLAAASKALPDLDVSDSYPFYLLDYEEIAPAVAQWCTIHATRLLQQLPDQVDNPRCLECKFFRTGLDASGLCKGLAVTKCGVHPFMPFSIEAILPYLISKNINVANLTPGEAQIIYTSLAEEAYEKLRTE